MKTNWEHLKTQTRCLLSDTDVVLREQVALDPLATAAEAIYTELWKQVTEIYDQMWSIMDNFRRSRR